jgi:hypothetical protein
MTTTDREQALPEPREVQDAGAHLGSLVGVFADFRAGVLQGLGVVMALLGALATAGASLFGGEVLATYGVVLMVIGAGAFLFGTWRRAKRLSVHRGGFVVRAWGVDTFYLWQDIHRISLDQALYSQQIKGLFYFVASRNECFVQLKDGRCIPLSFPLLSSEAVAALCESWERWRGAAVGAERA